MRRIEGYRSAFTIIVPTIVSIAFAALLGGCGDGTSATLSKSEPVTLDSVQRQIAELPCPPGVSSALWDTITSELMQQLTRRASTEALTAGPPMDGLSKVDDLAAAEDHAGGVRLAWSYRNTGDYDQNSETNISDLTPIGRHFAKTPASADWNSARVADGDLNREVNISDVTPIGRCFLQTVTEYRVEYKPSTGGLTAYSALGAVAFGIGEKGGSDWLEFAATYPAETGYYRVVPYYNDQRGIEGDPVYFKISNLPPTAVLYADPQIGESPLTVHFDASKSSDPDQDELTFHWDWEGDCVVDYDSGTESLVEHEYTDLGDYAPRVTVRDAAGAEDDDGVMVYCHEWEMYPITAGLGASAPTVVDGRPAFWYEVSESPEPGDVSLHYARSKVAVPASADDWDLMLAVPPEKEEDGSWTCPGGATDAFMLEGRPAFVYYLRNMSGVYKAMYLAHATTAEPLAQGDWEISLITDDPDLVDPVNDAICLSDVVYLVVSSPGPGDLVLLFRSLVSNPSGPGDWEMSEICDQGHNGHFDSGAYVNFIGGKLCVAVNQMDDMQVDFATTSNLAPQGPQDWTYMVADTSGETLFRPRLSSVSLAEIPFIVSQQDGLTHLQGVRVTNATTGTPMTSADWTGTTQLGVSYNVGGRPVPTGSICALLCVRRYETEPKKFLALYPPRSGLAGLDEPDWVMEIVDPPVLESVPEQPGELAKDWIFSGQGIPEGGSLMMYFLRCKTKAHYTLW